MMVSIPETVPLVVKNLAINFFSLLVLFIYLGYAVQIIKGLTIID